MARYCFYCGRELAVSERCNCRAKSNSSTSSNSAQSSSGAQAGQADGTTYGHAPKSSRLKGFFQAFNPFASSSSQAAGQSKSNTQSSRTRKTRKTREPLSSRHLISIAKDFFTYLTHPVNSISKSIQGRERKTVLLTLLFQGVIGGLFMLTAVNQPFIRTLLTLNIASLSGSFGIAGSIFLFVQGFGIVIAATLLLALLYQLMLRFLYRKPLPYLDILSAFTPSCLYFALFLTLSMLSVSTSFFSAVMLILAGFAVAALAQNMAVRQLSSLDENKSFMLVVFAMLIYSSLLSMLFNLSMPVITALLEQPAVY